MKYSILDYLPPSVDDTFSLYCVACVTGISPRTLRRAIARGVFPGTIIRHGKGGKIFLTRAQLTFALNRNLLPTPYPAKK